MLVKRNMEQDGLMMGDKHVFYVRDRKTRFCIYDSDYAIRLTHQDFNGTGNICLAVHWFVDEPTEFEFQVMKAIDRSKTKEIRDGRLYLPG